MLNFVLMRSAFCRGVPLGQPTALVRCSMCVDDLFQFYTVVFHTTGYIFMSTRKSISSIAWTD